MNAQKAILPFGIFAKEGGVENMVSTEHIASPFPREAKRTSARLLDKVIGGE